MLLEWFFIGSSVPLQCFLSRQHLWFLCGSLVVPLRLFSASQCLFYTGGCKQKAKYLLWWVIITHVLLHHSSVQDKKWINLQLAWPWGKEKRPRENCGKEWICSVTAGRIHPFSPCFCFSRAKKYIYFSESQSNSNYLIAHKKNQLTILKREFWL